MKLENSRGKEDERSKQQKQRNTGKSWGCGASHFQLHSEWIIRNKQHNSEYRNYRGICDSIMKVLVWLKPVFKHLWGLHLSLSKQAVICLTPKKMEAKPPLNCILHLEDLTHRKNMNSLMFADDMVCLASRKKIVIGVNCSFKPTKDKQRTINGWMTSLFIPLCTEYCQVYSLLSSKPLKIKSCWHI